MGVLWDGTQSKWEQFQVQSASGHGGRLVGDALKTKVDRDRPSGFSREGDRTPVHGSRQGNYKGESWLERNSDK